MKDNKRVEHWLYGDLNNENEVTPIHSSITEQQAKQQLMHALLLQTQDTVNENDARIEQVLAKISKRNQSRLFNPSKPENNINQLFKRWANIAAVILVIVGLSFSLMLPSNEAMAAMDKIIARLSDMGSRVYDVKVEPIKQGKKGKNTSQVANAGTAKTNRFIGGKLYLNGTNQFVLIANTIDKKGNSKIKISGSNGFESWSIGGEGNVKTAPHAKVKLPLSGDTSALTFMNMPQMLTALKQTYDLTIEHNQAASHIAGLWSKITLTKKDNRTKGVKSVVLFFNSDTNEIQQMVFDKVHLQGQASVNKVIMTLLSNRPIESNWFNHQSHL